MLKILLVSNMKHEIDLNKYNIRTDLILESIENNNNKIDTITENHDGILVTSVNVDDKSSSLLNKEKGKYTTILFEDATDSTNASKIEEVLISVLKEYIGNKNKQHDRSNIVDKVLGMTPHTAVHYIVQCLNQKLNEVLKSI